MLEHPLHANSFPELTPHQCVLIRAEIDTGKVLTISGKRVVSLEDNLFSIFENIEDAEAFIDKDKLNHNDWEFIILNSKLNEIKTIRGDGLSPIRKLDFSKMTSIKIDKRRWFEKLLRL